MKKILLVHSSGVMSGGENISYYIYKHLKDDFIFSFFIPTSKNKSNFFINEINIYYSKKNNLFNKIKSLSKCIRQIQPDIVHVHGTRAALLVKLVLLFKRKNFKFIYTIHGFHVAHKKGLKNKLILLIENFSNIFVDCLICVGSEDYDLVINNSIKKKSVVLINNGVIEPIPNINTELELIKNKSNFLILTICRLHYQKDVATLIRAVSLFKKDVTLIIIGDGPQRKELENLARNVLTDNIIFLGNIKNASSLIHYADSFILSTYWEGLPLVLLEAMLSRVLVVASNVHGVRSLIKDGETGFLFKKGDYIDLVKKIKQSLCFNKERLNIINNAQDLVKKEYSINDMVKKYKDLYNNL